MYRIYQRLGLHILVVLMTILQADHVTWGCPADVCICKWKNGKQTVECGGQQLPNIPEGMDASTQVLNFSGNALQVLQSERFLRMDLLNLQKIYLSRNQLIRIHEKAFRGLSNLVELDLSDNALQHVPTETFQDYGSLMRLSLTGNPIRELKSTAFRHLSFLTTLELSNCQIERVENEAFVGLDNLEWLRLDGNRIGFIQGTHILPKALHGISLHSNRWMCDCRLLDIHAWLINYNTPQSDEPKCVEPARLKGQTIKSLKKDELACLPEVSPTSSYTEISQGRNISIMCVVRAIPEPKILWLFNGQVMTNDSFVDNLHMYYYIEESASGSAEEKRSEIFIYNVGAEDNGTFSCVGTNVAGTTFSNYTLRVIIEEPPVVNEVSFPRDYMKYIIVSSTGGGVMVFIIVGTILLKCKQRKPDQKRGKKYAIGSGSVTTALTNLNSNGSSGNDDNSNIKCSSIINGDGDSLNGSGGLIIGEGRTPTKACKENGVILGGQMKQNLMLYAPLDHMQQNQQHQHLQHQQQQQQQEQHQQQKQQHQQQNMDGVTLGGPGSLQINITNTPPPALIMSSNGLAYCSPPGSVRNYQEKNPDLVNDAAESVKHKTIIKSAVSSLDTDCDAASDCSGPCSIQSMSVAQAPVQYDNCYQLAAAAQFGSQLMRPAGMPNMHMNSNSRFAAISTLPRGMQLKTLMSGLNMTPTGNPQSAAPQHQVDVHLNPVCFLSQDGFAYDFSNAAAHHHAYLQQQHALNSLHHSNSTVQQKPQGQQQHQQQQQQQQQQNFYRTLPHNRVNKQQQFAAASTTNPNMRYSLEAEFLQNRSNTSNYEKYLPNVRFTAEGYPQAQHQYPSPPEGYKTSGPVTSCGSLDTMEGVGTTSLTTPTFQQWPPCLPGFQIQPIRYPPTIVGVLSPQQQQLHKPMAQTPPSQSQQPTSETITQKPIPTQNHTQATTSGTATSGTGKDSISIASNASATGTTMEMKKRCMTAQADNSTIPECDESEVSPSTSMVVGNSIQDNMGSGSTASGATKADAGKSEQSTPKLRHLNGPLADSPDEGYVGEAPESSDI